MAEELQITFAKGTDVGRVRDHNEDWVGAQSPVGAALQRMGHLFIVADGMGGYLAGEVASQMAGETATRIYFVDPSDDPSERLRNAVQAANQVVYASAQSNSAHSGMGTTMVALALIGRKADIASVGDSRAYIVHQSELAQITQDHSFVGEQVRAGILTKEQARVHPQRNVITRALGSQAHVQVDTFVGELTEGDVLILCTDGLTGHVTEACLRETVLQAPPDKAVEQLIQMAKDDGGTDNITAIVLRAGPLPASTDDTAPIVRGDTATVVAARPAAMPADAKGKSSAAWLLAAALVILIGGGVVALGILSLGGAYLLGGPAATPTTMPAIQTVLPTPLRPTPTVFPAASSTPPATVPPTPTPPTSPLNPVPAPKS